VEGLEKRIVMILTCDSRWFLTTTRGGPWVGMGQHHVVILEVLTEPSLPGLRTILKSCGWV
jgi:hypothetical protein